VEERLPNYGGQAVFEGVMMRGKNTCSIAVRAPDQSIEIKSSPLSGLYTSNVSKIPLLRGLLALGDALVLGMQALTFSANVQADEDEQIEGAPLFFTLAFSILIGIGLFFLLPAGLTYWVESALQLNSAMSNLMEGLIRLALLIGYVGLIGLMPDIRRVYGYHGAEHKTINAYEHQAPLTVESVKTFSREHPRCGTAFLLTVVIFSIILFSLVGPLPIVQRLLSRILFVPVLAMFAYEYIRFTGKHAESPWLKPLIWPNLALQRLTTKEPDDLMLEVAIAAFEDMRSKDQVAL
jgi:uncharacterized protein YqhQ